MQGESPQEALDRAAAVVIEAIADETGMRLSSELRPGDSVRVAGEFLTVKRVTDVGDLILTTEGGHSLFYKVGEGERFLVGAF